MKFKTSVTVNNNSPIQDFVHLDDHTQPTYEMTLGFKPFTVLMKVLWNYWKCKCPALQIPWDCHTYNSRHRALASIALCLARLHLASFKMTEQAALSVWNGHHFRHSVIKTLFWTSFLFLLYLANWTACANQPNPSADSGTGNHCCVWYIFKSSKRRKVLNHCWWFCIADLANL